MGGGPRVIRFLFALELRLPLGVRDPRVAMPLDDASLGAALGECTTSRFFRAALRLESVLGLLHLLAERLLDATCALEPRRRGSEIRDLSLAALEALPLRVANGSMLGLALDEGPASGHCALFGAAGPLGLNGQFSRS
jgi:hypothetical protein